MPFELRIALRYLRVRRSSVASILGVGIGVMALVVALALMTGLQSELRARILGATAHVYVFKRSGLADYQAEVAKLRQIPNVKGVAPAIIGKALLSTPGGGEAFVTLKGIDPALEGSVTDIAKAVTAGKLEDLDSYDEDRPDGIFLGKDVAQTLAVGLGDIVNVQTPQSTTLSPMGMMIVPHRLRVAGIFHLGFYEFDSSYGFLSLRVAERLLNRSQPELIMMTVDDVMQAPAVTAAIQARLGADYFASDWTTMNQSLFSALFLEKMAISITIGLIVIVAALNIVASLVLLVLEKRADIAILKTMGASSRSMMYVFMAQGLVIGLLGTLAGSSLGMALSWFLDRYHLIRVPGDVYQISYLPFTLLPLNLLTVVVLSVVVCFVATIYPSRQAARLKPVEALRYG
jgi:lipoprotein-releasing system permease protein